MESTIRTFYIVYRGLLWQGADKIESEERPPDLGQWQWVKGIKINQIGKDYSISVASVQGVEHPQPTMRIPLGHIYRSTRRIIQIRS